MFQLCNLMSLLYEALVIAKKAHRGQTDKAGMPYWLHPYRVGLSVAEYGENVVVTGFLHDVVEDTDITLRQLVRFGFTPRVIGAVAALTRKENESYRNYITRVESNHVAVQVKIADLTDNLREDRLRNLWGVSKFRRKTCGMYQQYLTMLTEKYRTKAMQIRISHDAALCERNGEHPLSVIDLRDPPPCVVIEKEHPMIRGYVQILVVENKQKE